jgi:hypothetical protein
LQLVILQHSYREFKFLQIPVCIVGKAFIKTVTSRGADLTGGSRPDRATLPWPPVWITNSNMTRGKTGFHRDKASSGGQKDCRNTRYNLTTNDVEK